MIETIISSSEFFVYYSEYDIFLLLVKVSSTIFPYRLEFSRQILSFQWIYLAMHPDVTYQSANLSETVFEYFTSGRNGECKGGPIMRSLRSRSYIVPFVLKND